MFDILIIIFLAIGAYEGFKQGLFVGLISFVAFVVALMLAFHLMHWGAGILAEQLKDSSFVLPFVAFLLIFFGVLMVVRGLAFMVKKSMDVTVLGTADDIVGGLLGIFKSVLFLSFLIWIAESFEFTFIANWTKDSKIYPFVQPIAPWVVAWIQPLLPIFQDTIDKIYDLVKATADGIVD